MNETTNVLRGTLNSDGTLELVDRPTLPAGPVEVTIRPVVEVVSQPGWWEAIQGILAIYSESGAPSRTVEEIHAELAYAKDWGEERLEAIRAEVEARRRAEESP
jgi:hypothetical protein